MSTSILVEEGCEIGECAWCGDKDVRIYQETRMCDDCDSRHYPCSICKELQFDEDLCRHIFKDRNFEWSGSGAFFYPYLKKPLFRLFDLMPGGFATDLRRAVRSGKFHTWLVAPMIGSGGHLTLHGMPERDGKWVESWWGNFLLEIGQGEHAEKTADGYHWLVSLYDRKTLKANKQTIQWIDEYLALASESR